jgi:PKD repeat protein/endonuclease/exonuclease/phosphatase family metal-dependent hydrolase
MKNRERRAMMRAGLGWFLSWLILGSVLPAHAQSNAVVRVMAANLNGDSQSLGPSQLNILKGLKADIVAMQEFLYSDNSPSALRQMIDATFGTNYVYYREPGYTLPNGIISRYPIVASGSWDDPDVSNRGFAWAQVDLPGTNDLYIVSVHLLTTSATVRSDEATNLKALIQANFPSNAWIIVAGDFNTDSRSEAAVSTFKTFLSDNPIPTDTTGNPNTNLPRNKPYDYVLPSFAMTNTLTPVVFPSHTFSNGLVFVSFSYTPLSDVPPVVAMDSSNCQHMAVIKDFLIPTLSSGALLAVTPASDFLSTGQTGGPFTPSSQNYTVSNTGDSNLNWAVTAAAAWLTVSPTNGTLIAGTSTNITVSISPAANSLAIGNYSDTIAFTNLTSGAGSTARAVNLTVNSTFPVIVTNGWTVGEESCTPTNGAVDPGETVTINLPLKNIGTANTSNLVATLLASTEVNSPDGPYTYGVISTNGTVVTQAFTFTAGGTCGSNITATLQLQDGAVNLGTVSYTIPLGVTTGIFTQNFDSVTAPTLPAGWTTSASGAQPNWVTATASADTAPNAAYSPDSGDVGVNELDSPSIAINSTMARLTFRHNYSLTASSVNSATGYNGGVLEIKIGSGSYTDIVAAGGSFVTGGYNRTLSGDYGNPLAGRPAWSGVSSGFTPTVVNLPASAAGQNIQLRWHCASGTNPPPMTSSGTLAYWDFEQTNGMASAVAANLTATPVTNLNVSGVAVTFPTGNPGLAISSINFVTTAGPPTTSFSCWSFNLTVANGAQATLSSLSFDDRASGTGPTKFSVQVSTQSVFSAIYDSGIQSTHTAFSTTPMNTSTLSLSNLTGTIYFRIYGYQSGALTGTWRIDNVNIQGSVTAGGTMGGSGWYVDTVSIQDAFCCSSSVNPPVADFAGSPTSGTAPLNVTFTDNSTGNITNRFWDFGDGGTTNITTNSIVHTYGAGTFNVSLTVSGPDGDNNLTRPAYITALTPFQSWQLQYFGSTNCALCGPSVDFDGDGQNNQAEFDAGTDPTNSAAFFGITSIAATGSDVRVTWQTGVGKTNALQATSGSSYATNGFADIFIATNTVGSATNFTHTGATTNAPAQYYRVRLVP